MAAYGLLIGTKGEKRTLIADGDPREMRTLFKASDGDGFDKLEVVDTRSGRTKRRSFKKRPAKKAAKKAAYTISPE